MSKIFKTSISFLFTIGLLYSITSCSTDIDYNPPDIKRSIAIYSILKPDSLLSVFVTRSQNLNDEDIAYVSDATVKILDENGMLLDSALYTGDGLYQSKFKIIENQKITINVESSGFDAVNASDYTPQKVIIKKAEYLRSFEYDPINDYEYGLLTLVFQDNPNDKNFYEIVLLNDHQNGSFGRLTPFIISNEFVSINSNELDRPRSILFNDVLCNGKEIVLRIKVHSSMAPYVVVRNTTETYYRYQKSLYTYLYTQPEQNDRYFNIDPVNVFTNVTNGFGIVAGYCQDEYQSVNINEE